MTTCIEDVVVVDSLDRAIGVLDKYRAHVDAVRHRALSVFIFDHSGRLLLQQRATGKYHSAGLWSNTCCSHPRPGENVARAAARRLDEEMGLRSPLVCVGSVLYRLPVGQGLIEHEFDHIYVGVADENPVPDETEAMDYLWLRPEQLIENMRNSPQRYSAWLAVTLRCVMSAGWPKATEPSGPDAPRPPAERYGSATLTLDFKSRRRQSRT